MIRVIIFISLKDFSDFHSILFSPFFSREITVITPDNNFICADLKMLCIVCTQVSFRALWPFDTPYFQLFLN